MRANRGTLTEAGKDSPFRNRSVAENQDLFKRMQAGEFADGAHILRAKIDMAAPPTSTCGTRPSTASAMRRTHNTGDKYCVYPMYTFAHPIEDALENITHSICTLEFEDQRPFYDWLLERLAEGGLLQRPLPHQYEFSRLNLTYVVLSKRKLIQLVEEKHVDGWDDPRMPTLVGARRRGYTAEGFRLLMERVGVSKHDSLIDYSLLEDCMRETMNELDERRIAVLDPLKLVITNYPEGQSEECFAPNHPLKPELGKRMVPFSRELWIEREDFMEEPSKGYHRLYPGNMAPPALRLRGQVHRLREGCRRQCHPPCCASTWKTPSPAPPAPTTTRSRATCTGSPWPTPTPPKCASTTACSRPAAPGAGDRDFLDDLNPASKVAITVQLEPALKDVLPETALPVRAPRLLRRRPGGLPTRRPGLQPGRHPQGLLGQGGLRLRAQNQEPGADHGRRRLGLPPRIQRSLRQGE